MELGERRGENHWKIASGLLEEELSEFDRTAWDRARHGARAALAVIETALIVRTRAGTEDPIRSGPAYLGGILRRQPADCRPEITLQRLAAAREDRAGRGDSGREARSRFKRPGVRRPGGRGVAVSRWWEREVAVRPSHPRLPT